MASDTVSNMHVPGEFWTLGAGQGCAPGYANQQAAGVNRWTCIPMKTFQQIQALDFSGLAEVEGLADHYYQLAGGKPTASANVAYGGTGNYSVSVVGGSRLVFDDGNTTDDDTTLGGGGSTQPVRRPDIPDRARDVGDTELGGGAIPRRFSRAVPTILGGGGEDGGGSGGGGTGGGTGTGGSGSGSGTGSPTGAAGSGTGGSSTGDSAIDRLIDLVAAQYAGAGGGVGGSGGVVALPTEISSDSGGSTSSGGGFARVLLVVGVVVAAIWYYRKHKKQTAAAA